MLSTPNTPDATCTHTAFLRQKRWSIRISQMCVTVTTSLRLHWHMCMCVCVCVTRMTEILHVCELNLCAFTCIQPN